MVDNRITKRKKQRRLGSCVTCGEDKFIRAHDQCDRCYDAERHSGTYGAIFYAHQDRALRAYIATTTNPWDDPKYRTDVEPWKREQYRRYIAELLKTLKTRKWRDDPHDPGEENRRLEELERSFKADLVA